jgi:hypothetical protein
MIFIPIKIPKKFAEFMLKFIGIGMLILIIFGLVTGR